VVAGVWRLATGPDEALEKADSLASVSGLVIAVVSLSVSALALIMDLRRSRAGSENGSTMAKATALLAARVDQQWNDEAGVRRLRHPRPLRLHWKSTSQPAGAAAITVGPGQLDDGDGRLPASGLVDAFRTLPARQLVVLGEPGAGKSTLALLFTLAAIGLRRPGAPVGPPAGEPVPVLLPVASWRPDEETLRAWVARRIGEDYPELTNQAEFGAGMTTSLVDGGMILPILDGLDEMPRALVNGAIKALNDAAGVGGLAMVITCREHEYHEMVKVSGRLPLAAVVTIRPITVEDSIDFLTEAEPPSSDRWDPVVAEMRAEPEGPLAHALSTPLMTALARTVHEPAGTRPADLTGLRSAGTVERRLLERFLPTVYPGEGSREVRAFVFLAHHLQYRLDTRDLQWWQLGWAVPRVVTFAVVAGVMTLAGVLASALVMPFPETRRYNAALGTVLSLGAGVVAGLNAMRSGVPAPANRSRRRTAGGIIAAALRDGLAAAVVLVVGTALVRYPAVELNWETGLTLLEVATFGSVLGTALGVTTSGSGVWWGSILTRPSLRLRSLLPQLAAGIGTGLMIGVPVGAAIGLIDGIDSWDRQVGLGTALWMTAAVGAAIAVPVGVGRWLSTPVGEHDPLSPRSAMRGNAMTLVVVAVSAGVSLGFGFGVMARLGERFNFLGYHPNDPTDTGVWGGFAVFGLVLLGSGAPWVSYRVAHLWLALWGLLPWRLMRFLDDAHRRGILRQAGPVYQFRHARLQEYFAREWRRKKRHRLMRLASRPGRQVRPTRRSMHRARVLRGITTGVAAVVLLGLVGTVTVPAAREQIKLQIDHERSAEADLLIAYADAIQASRPNDALSLRIAAVEVDSDDSSLEELPVFLRAHGGNALRKWTHTQRAYFGERWAVAQLLDDRLVAWDQWTSPPREITLGHGSLSLHFDPNGRWVTASMGEEGHVAWDLSTTPPRRAPLGEGWVSLLGDRWGVHMKRDGTAEAWDLNAMRRTSFRLGWSGGAWQQSADGRWIVLNDDERAEAWDLAADPPRRHDLGADVVAFSIDAGGGVVLVHRLDGTATAFDLRDPVVVPVSLGRGLAKEIVGQWGVFVSRNDGTRTLLDFSRDAPREVFLDRDAPVDEVVGDRRVAVAYADGAVLISDPSDDSWRPIDAGRRVGDMITSGTRRWLAVSHPDGTAHAWDLAATPPRSYPLGVARRVLDVSDSGTVIFLREDGITVRDLPGTGSSTVAHTRHDVETAYTTTGGRWLVARHEDGTATGWDLAATHPRPVDLGPQAYEVMISSDGRWATVQHDQYSFGTLVTIWDVAAAKPLPAHAVTGPHEYACRVVKPGMDADAWQRSFPDLPYRDLCRKFLQRRGS
jgi:hypothetical protein